MIAFMKLTNKLSCGFTLIESQKLPVGMFAGQSLQYLCSPPARMERLIASWKY
jgi:hypothetical protein